jgi:hypothetical protein
MDDQRLRGESERRLLGDRDDSGGHDLADLEIQVLLGGEPIGAGGAQLLGGRRDGDSFLRRTVRPYRAKGCREKPFSQPFPGRREVEKLVLAGLEKAVERHLDRDAGRVGGLL